MGDANDLPIEIEDTFFSETKRYDDSNPNEGKSDEQLLNSITLAPDESDRQREHSETGWTESISLENDYNCRRYISTYITYCCGRLLHRVVCCSCKLKCLERRKEQWQKARPPPPRPQMFTTKEVANMKHGNNGELSVPGKLEKTPMKYVYTRVQRPNGDTRWLQDQINSSDIDDDAGLDDGWQEEIIEGQRFRVIKRKPRMSKNNRKVQLICIFVILLICLLVSFIRFKWIRYGTDGADHMDVIVEKWKPIPNQSYSMWLNQSWIVDDSETSGWIRMDTRINTFTHRILLFHYECRVHQDNCTEVGMDTPPLTIYIIYWYWELGIVSDIILLNATSNSWNLNRRDEQLIVDELIDISDFDSTGRLSSISACLVPRPFYASVREFSIDGPMNMDPDIPSQLTRYRWELPSNLTVITSDREGKDVLQFTTMSRMSFIDNEYIDDEGSQGDNATESDIFDKFGNSTVNATERYRWIDWMVFDFKVLDDTSDTLHYRTSQYEEMRDFCSGLKLESIQILDFHSHPWFSSLPDAFIWNTVRLPFSLELWNMFSSYQGSIEWKKRKYKGPEQLNNNFGSCVQLAEEETATSNPEETRLKRLEFVTQAPCFTQLIDPIYGFSYFGPWVDFGAIITTWVENFLF